MQEAAWQLAIWKAWHWKAEAIETACNFLYFRLMQPGRKTQIQGPSEDTNRDETSCRFVSSRGLLKSTSLHALRPKSSKRKIPWDLRLRLPLTKGGLYLCTDMVPSFVQLYLRLIRSPFTLVSGDSDTAAGAEGISEDHLHKLLGHPLLLAWHAQNRVHDHPKLHSIPIGLDYHSMAEASRHGPNPWGKVQSPKEQEQEIRTIARSGGGFATKSAKAFSNWHFQIERGNRKTCFHSCESSAVHYQEALLPRNESWRRNTKCAFTLSPFGNGLDCHRTWEALLLGTVPIVTRSILDCLYEGLPVLIVDDWREVTAKRLADEFQSMAGRLYDFSRLELAFWTAKIRGAAPPAPNLMTIDAFVLANR
jgi:hypothetical protein